MVTFNLLHGFLVDFQFLAQSLIILAICLLFYLSINLVKDVG
jgi:hypothetical protein